MKSVASRKRGCHAVFGHKKRGQAKTWDQLAMQETDLRRAIRAGQGKEPADLVLKNARLLDVITGTVAATDIAVVGDRIVGTHAQYRGHAEIDCSGRFAVPGFIDTHLHIESSLITPFEFDRCVLP